MLRFTSFYPMKTKGEEKIIKLLEEYLRKTDRALEQLKRNDLKFEKMLAELKGNEKRSAKNDLKFDKMFAEFEKNDRKFEGNDRKFDLLQKSIDKHAEEIAELRKDAKKRSLQQDVLLKEILSISRRVHKLEDK